MATPVGDGVEGVLVEGGVASLGDGDGDGDGDVAVPVSVTLMASSWPAEQ